MMVSLAHPRTSPPFSPMAQPLHAAALNGKADCLRLLLQFGANPNALDHTGYSALHWAAYTGQPEVREAESAPYSSLRVHCLHRFCVEEGGVR